MLRKQWVIAVLNLLLTAGLASPGWAETVIEKVVRTGTLTAGTRVDAIPLSYINDKGELVGYSIDILNLIKAELEQRLGKQVELDFVPVTPEDRIPKVVSHEVDIVCGATSFTWDRTRFVDFSVAYLTSGTQLLVKKDSPLNSPESLSGKRVGVLPQTTNEQAMKLVQPRAILVPIQSISEGFTALEQGKIDVLASDGILLEGLQQTVANPAIYRMFPEQPYSREGIACMLPQDDSSFRNLVNYTLIRYMQGVVSGNSQEVASFDRWFGPNGVIQVEREPVLGLFRYTIDTHEQILVNPAPGSVPAPK